MGICISYSKLLGGRGGNLKEISLSFYSFIQIFQFCVEILRQRCKEGLGVSLQAKYRHITNPNRGRSAKDKYYVDDGGKYENRTVLIFLCSWFTSKIAKQ